MQNGIKKVVIQEDPFNTNPLWRILTLVYNPIMKDIDTGNTKKTTSNLWFWNAW